MSVNLSPKLFAQPDLVPQIAGRPRADRAAAAHR